MPEQNPFHGTSLRTMRERGLTPEEHSLSQNENLTFSEKIEKLRAGAEIIAQNTKFANAIVFFSQQHGGVASLTEKDCEQFLIEHPGCPYEAGMVFAIAEKMETLVPRTSIH